MMEELRFAVRCHGSAKKPALTRRCSKCMHHSDDPCTVESPNGIIQLRDMRDISIRKSPLPSLNNREPHFRYHEPTDHVYSDYRDAVHAHALTHT